MQPTFFLPDTVQKILFQLNKAGFSAYIVGGCVRDCLCGIQPADWDICTSALPQQTKAVFSDNSVIETGIQHGTVTVLMDGEPFEITTFRIEGSYSDGRRPDSVSFSTDVTQDLSRRDFTINAMAYHPTEGFIDPFGGKSDLEQNRLRCVGDPVQRFSEDALRIMRGLRFLSRFGFEVDPSCDAALHRCKHLLTHVSAERIFSELCKLLCENHVEQVLLNYSDILFEILPELAPMKNFEQHNVYHVFDVWQHTVKAVSCSNRNLMVRLTMLFHDIGKPQCYSYKDGVGHFYGHPQVSTELANSILLRLKTSTHLRNTVCTLVQYHDCELSAKPSSIKRWLNKLGKELFLLLLEVKKADILAQNPKFYDRLSQIDFIQQLTAEILAQNSCISLQNLAVSGKDLLELGYPQGKQIGVILNFLLEQVLSDQLENNKDSLISYITQNQNTLLNLTYKQ